MMVPFPLILFCLLILVIIYLRWIKLKTKEQKSSFALQGILCGLVLFVVLLATLGKIHFMGAVFAVALLFIKFITALITNNSGKHKPNHEDSDKHDE